MTRRIATASRISGKNLDAGWSADGKRVAWRRRGKSFEAGAPTTFDFGALQFGEPLGGAKFLGAILQQGPFTLKVTAGDPVQVLKNGKSLSVKLPENNRLHWGFGHTLIGKNQAVISAVGRSYLMDLSTGKSVVVFPHRGTTVVSAAPSPDGRCLLTLAADQILRIWGVEKGNLLLSLFVFRKEWIAWTPGGYYAASLGGEKLMGWLVDNGIDQAPSFQPAQRFRKQFYRPDVIKLVLEKGSVEEALQAAGVKTRTSNRACRRRRRCV